MDFADLSHKLLDLYLEGSYREALQLVDQGRREFPDEDQTLTWFEGCLLGVSGESDRSLEVFEKGLDRGLGWHPKMLLDPDLDSVRTLDGWEAFEQRSAASVEEWSEAPPPTMTRETSDAVGTVIALHGGGADPDENFQRWATAIPDNWSLVAPAGDVPVGKSLWGWPFDLATDSLLNSLDGLSLTEPIVVSGISQGARLAARAVWDGDIEPAGLILIAAVLTTDAWVATRQLPVPLFLFIGSEDRGRGSSVETVSALEEAGVPVRVEIRQELGHQIPDDFDHVMRTGLDWIHTQGRS